MMSPRTLDIIKECLEYELRCAKDNLRYAEDMAKVRGADREFGESSLTYGEHVMDCQQEICDIETAIQEFNTWRSEND